MPKLDEYLTIKEAAEYLGVSPNTLRNWGARGKIAVHRNPVNGYRLFRTRDLQRILTRTKESATRSKRKAR